MQPTTEPDILLNISCHRTCIVAVVRYVYIVRQNEANAEYFIWRFPSPFPFPLAHTRSRCLPPICLRNRQTDTQNSMMEINIGVMCSCMPALRPLFGRIIPKLSIHSIRSKISRTRYHHGSSAQAEEGGAIIEMEPYRGGGGSDANNDGSASTERSPRMESVGDGDRGVRNIVAF